jgi:hypothetical protein
MRTMKKTTKKCTAQAGAAALHFTAALDESRSRLRGTERRVEVEAARRKSVVDVEKTRVEAKAAEALKQCQAKAARDLQNIPPSYPFIR